MGTISSRLKIKNPQNPPNPRKKRNFEAPQEHAARETSERQRRAGALALLSAQTLRERVRPRAGAGQRGWVCLCELGVSRQSVSAEGGRTRSAERFSPELVSVRVPASTSACSQEKQFLCQKSNFWVTFPFLPLSWYRSRRYKARGVSSVAIACRE